MSPDKIDLRIAPAIDTLRSLPEDQGFDFAFIDADKAGYAAYYEEILGPDAGRRLDPRRQHHLVRAGCSIRARTTPTLSPSPRSTTRSPPTTGSTSSC